mmetsp:Transcript_3721/g.4617  ORF Transcript_3721/g.4617 Transcript_3721/m.4617 type:complete len:427 (-) Transcript_3721:113-1393(-)
MSECDGYYNCEDCYLKSNYFCVWAKEYSSSYQCLPISSSWYDEQYCQSWSEPTGISPIAIIMLIFFGCYCFFGIIIGAIMYVQRTNKEGANEPEISEDPMDMAFDKRFKKSEEAKGLRTIIQLIYFYARKGIFNLLSILLGIILAILWGYTMGFYEFYLVWFVLPWIDITKRIYLPLANVVGDVMNAIFGRCLRNFKTQPAWFTFGGIHGNNNNIEYNKLATDDDDYEQKFDATSIEGDEYGLKFITAFPKSDEIDGIRKIERICYDVCRIGGYNFLTGLIGVPFSLIWGLIYGILQFLITWSINPSMKIYRMYLIPFGQLVGSLLNSIFGKCFRNVRAEPYYFGFGSNNVNNVNERKKSDIISVPGINDGQNAPLLMEMPANDGGNITGNGYNNISNINNNNNNIMPYQTTYPVSETQTDIMVNQ